MPKENAYITLLKEARDQLALSEGISYREFKTRYKELGINQHPERIFRSIYDPPTHDEDRKYHMCIDAYMMLLEYDELQNSLKESKQARKEARRALLFAGGAIVVQVVLWLIDKINS